MPSLSDSEASDTARELAREVIIHGPISRSDLGRRLRLSPASLTRLSKPFLERGLFVEAAEIAGGPGRPTRPLDVRVDAHRFIGVKVTGDAAVAVLTDLRATAVARAERPFDDHAVPTVVRTIAALVAELCGPGVDVDFVGVSVGGNVSGQRVVTRAPFLGWRDVPLADLLEEKLRLPVAVDNDVVALTTAEHWFGAVRGASAFAVVTIGAGVGYGLVMHDQVVSTVDSGLGLGGHLPLDGSGPLCAQGHRGCSTAMLSIPSIEAQVSMALGSDVDYDEVLDLARSGHPVAAAVTNAAGRSLGRMLVMIANIAMVDAIVLTGDGVALWEIVGGVAAASMAEDRDPEATRVAVHVDTSGFDSWARGAAAIAIQNAVERLRVPAGTPVGARAVR
ncbi:ROK family transcriptional regulator [Mycetocola sp. 2940]|uniref:ROK family transcriptional regulator n=1 Tax=Mycetocola sp. 2940 TaxID=3156452 RepID=UPI003395CA1D